MNKTLFHLAFVACVTATGCASPLRLFSKKPQPFDEYLAQQKAKNQTGAPSGSVPSSGSVQNKATEVAEFLNKGNAAFQQGLMTDAQASYQAVLQRQPDHAEANHRLAVIADRQSDFATAEKYYRAAITGAPRDSNVLNDLGYSYLLQSRYSEAEQYLTAALRQNPTQANAINNLGVLYAKQGQADRALAQFRRTGSEAEAQSKLTRSLPNVPSAAPAGTLLASNTGIPPQTTPVTNAGLNNTPRPNGTLPPAIPADFAQMVPGQTVSNPQSQFSSQSPPNAALSQSVNDPNISEAARQLKNAMEFKRQEAVAARIAQDNAERQRQAVLLRQVRDAELGRPPIGAPNGDNRAAPPPSNLPTGPIIVGPPPSNPNVGTMPGQYGDTVNGYAAPPQIPFPANTPPQYGAYPQGTMSSGFPAAPNPANAGQGTSQIWSVPNPTQPQVPQGLFAPTSIPNAMPNGPQTIPNVNNVNVERGSPLDAMPTWPPQEFIPANNPNSMNGASSFAPANTGWGNGAPGNMTVDPARTASHWGMNAGPGNLFPTDPNQTANGPGAVNAPNGFAPQDNFAPRSPISPPGNPGNGAAAPSPSNGFAPAPNMPAFQGGSSPNGGNVPQQSIGPGMGQSSRQAMPGSAAQFARQDQLPPSEQYQTPSGFGAWGVPNGAPGQPTNFAPNRGTPQPPRSYPTPNPRELLAEMERASTRSTVPDRAGGDDRWQQLAAPPGNSASLSTPTMQGFLATPAGEKALADYELMNQRHNAEANLIKQQIDAQRQLPGSENYYRSTTQPQLGTPTGTNPNYVRPASGTYPR